MPPRDPSRGHEITLHATCVDYQGKGVLILGASGSGKSALALALMAFGARLVADDRTMVTQSGELIATAPRALGGMIEARGVGILNADPVEQTVLRLAIDLDQTEKTRLPQAHRFRKDFISLPCLHKIDAAHFPFAILQYLRGGKREDT